jgi:hypothetical protein
MRAADTLAAIAVAAEDRVVGVELVVDEEAIRPAGVAARVGAVPLALVGRASRQVEIVEEAVHACAQRVDAARIAGKADRRAGRR